jgi:hypothetical protein
MKINITNYFLFLNLDVIFIISKIQINVSRNKAQYVFV